MNRLNNVSLTEVKELKIEQPPIIPDDELALQNKKTIAEIKQIEGNLEESVSMSSAGKEKCIEDSEDDDIPLKLLYKRHKMSLKHTISLQLLSFHTKRASVR
jgi:hypothetical protein